MRFYHFTQKGMELKMCAVSGIFHLTLQAAADPQLTDKVEIPHRASCGSHVHRREAEGMARAKPGGLLTLTSRTWRVAH